MEQLNYANSLFIIPKQLVKTNSIYYQYRVKRGNNSVVIKNCLKTRWWWKKADRKQTLSSINFRWVAGRNKVFICSLPVNQKRSYDIIMNQKSKNLTTKRSKLNQTPSTTNSSNRSKSSLKNSEREPNSLKKYRQNKFLGKNRRNKSYTDDERSRS